MRHNGAVRENTGLVDNVFQFTYVSRPVVIEQCFITARIQVFNGVARLQVVLPDKVVA